LTETAAATALYDLTDDHRAMRRAIRELVEGEVAPRAAEIDETDEYPEDLQRLFGEHDIAGLPFAEEYGGVGGDHLMYCIAIEEVSKASAAVGQMLAIWDLASWPLRFFGTEQQKQRFLPPLASGEVLPAFALSEPEAGSDPAGMRTRAVRDGDEWVISGEKNWISFVSVAGIITVFAVTDSNAPRHHGISCFVVEADSPGLSIGKLEHKMGMHGAPTGSPVFDEVRVPAENMIGPENGGFKVAMKTLDYSRLGIASQGLGIAQGATDYAAEYAKQRRQFGRPIAEFQAIQFKIADMETGNCAGRELLYQAAAKADRGDPDLGKYSAMAKLFCTDHAMRATTEAVQILGGYGYVKEYPVERMMRDAKLTQIYEGTNEIQRVVISRTKLR
jgi:alkylation response protein AidB-like acyl-CoA dehydrogenase